MSMKIDLYYQQQRCTAMTVDSGNVRFMPIFAEVYRDDVHIGTNFCAKFSLFGVDLICKKTEFSEKEIFFI